jgi:hypothetical protein
MVTLSDVGVAVLAPVVKPSDIQDTKDVVLVMMAKLSDLGAVVLAPVVKLFDMVTVARLPIMETVPNMLFSRWSRCVVWVDQADRCRLII